MGRNMRDDSWWAWLDTGLLIDGVPIDCMDWYGPKGEVTRTWEFVAFDPDGKAEAGNFDLSVYDLDEIYNSVVSDLSADESWECHCAHLRIAVVHAAVTMPDSKVSDDAVFYYHHSDPSCSAPTGAGLACMHS
jgi:hypothetical protein